MARGLSALPFVVMFALPVGAEAASKRVTVPVPANGDIAFSQYRVSTTSPGKAVIRNARRLGDLRIDVSGRRLSRRSYEVTVHALNPAGGASAAGEPKPVILLHSFVGDIGARQTGSANDLMSRSPTAKESSAISRRCRRPLPRSRRFFSTDRSSTRRFRFSFSGFVCQDGSTDQTIAGRATLAALGADPPTCMGSARRYLNLTNEIDARMICAGPTRAIGLLATPGNDGLNCVAPPGSACACGPACAPFPPESACFIDNDGFATNTLLNFRASYEGPIQPRDITAIWVPQGSPAVEHQFAYLRYVLEIP
jgi:hypothetical protein